VGIVLSPAKTNSLINSVFPIHSRKNIQHSASFKRRIAVKSYFNKVNGVHCNQSIFDEPAGLTVRTFALSSSRDSGRTSREFGKGRNLKKVFKISIPGVGK
jgi:hypothetical protein